MEKDAELKKKTASAKPAVFFDFDNTLTPYDVLDQVIRLFSPEETWRPLEDLWQAGKMGSKECLEGQLAGIRISKKDLARYLSEIKIDPSFKKIVPLVRRAESGTLL